MFLSPRNGVAVSAVRSNPLQNHLSARRCGTLPSARQESDELEEPENYTRRPAASVWALPRNFISCVVVRRQPVRYAAGLHVSLVKLSTGTARAPIFAPSTCL